MRIVYANTSKQESFLYKRHYSFSIFHRQLICEKVFLKVIHKYVFLTFKLSFYLFASELSFEYTSFSFIYFIKIQHTFSNYFD